MVGHGLVGVPDGAPLVNALGYIGLASPEIDAWSSFGTELLGLERADASTDDHLFFRADERAWRLSVERTTEREHMSYVGWEVTGDAALNRLAESFSATGADVHLDDQAASARGVQRLLWALDPAGNRNEFFHGALTAAQPLRSPSGARFITGDLGFSHIVLAVPDMQKVLDFYIGLLGFRISDHFQQGQLRSIFMRCNERHHSLAVAQHPQFSGMHHFLLEVDDVDIVGQAYDRAVAGAGEISLSFGRHANDRMISFYVKTPGGLDVEFGHGGRKVPLDTPHVSTLPIVSSWGHKPQGALADIEF